MTRVLSICKRIQNKTRRSLLTLCVVSLIGSMWILYSCAAAQPDKSVEGRVVIATTGRALERALFILGNQLHCVINYEDPPYEYPSTIQFLTPDGPEVPVERRLYFTYDPTRPKAEIIQNIIEEYHKSDDSVIFQLVTHKNQGVDTYSVIPSQVKTKEGEFKSWESPLDRNISLTLTDTYFAVASRIAELATQRIRAVRDNVRRDYFEEKVAFNAKNKSARACLNSLSLHYNSKHARHVTWGINRGPATKDAILWFQFEKHVPDAISPKDPTHTVSMYVESTRPLSEALRLMGRQSKKAIIFESPPYLCPCSVMKDHAGNPYTPRGNIFTFEYSSKVKFTTVLNEGIKTFNQDNVGEFVEKPVGNTFYVHPTVFMNAKEQTLPHKPLLETPISLSSKGKPIEESLKELCAALTAQTPYKVSLGELPSLPLFKQIATEDVTTQPAVEYLSNLSQKTGDKLSWQLLYMPKLSQYVLNAHLIGKE